MQYQNYHQIQLRIIFSMKLSKMRYVYNGLWICFTLIIQPLLLPKTIYVFVKISYIDVEICLKGILVREHNMNIIE